MTTNTTDKPEPGGTVLTVAEAALFLRVSESIVRRLIRERRIPHFRIEGRHLLCRAILEEWIRSLTITPDAVFPDPHLNPRGFESGSSCRQAISDGGFAGRQSSDRDALREYWELERNTWKNMDEDSIARRRDAEALQGAIGYVVAHTGLESNSSGSDGSGSEIPKEPNPENMTLAEAAYYLGLSRSTLYKWTSGNKIPYRKIGRKILSFTKKELDDFIARRKITSQDELADLAQESIDLLKLPRRIRGSRRSGEQSTDT